MEQIQGFLFGHLTFSIELETAPRIVITLLFVPGNTSDPTCVQKQMQQLLVPDEEQAQYKDCLGHSKSRVYKNGGTEREKDLKRKAKELLHLVISILTAWRAVAGLEKGRY